MTVRIRLDYICILLSINDDISARFRRSFLLRDAPKVTNTSKGQIQERTSTSRNGDKIRRYEMQKQVLARNGGIVFVYNMPTCDAAKQRRTNDATMFIFIRSISKASVAERANNNAGNHT